MSMVADSPILTKTQTTANRGWIVTRVFIAFVILTAAAMKAHQLATVPDLGKGLLHARWFNIAVVQFELAFGIWLLAGLMPKFTWLTSVGCFLVFASVSFYKGITGEASCGCFGAAVINPWYTMTFDLIVVFILLCVCPKQTDRLNAKIGQYALLWLFIAVPITIAILTFKPTTLKSDGTVSGMSSVVILDTATWKGDEFPLRHYVKSDCNLSIGNWVVVFYKNDCEKCRKHLIEMDSSDTSVLLLEISGNEYNSIRSEFTFRPWFWGVLDSSKQWFVNTPTIVKLRDGICYEVFNF